MPRRKHVLFVHSMYPHKISAYHAARRLGYRLSVVGPELPDWAEPLVDGFIQAGTDDSDIDTTVALLVERHAADPFDGVVTFWDHGVLPAAVIGTALGLPASTPDAAHRVRNKADSRDALAAAGVAHPRYLRVKDQSELAAAAGEVGFPAIYKPSGGAGSAGIQYLHSVEDVERVAGIAATRLRPGDDAFFGYYPGEFVLEQYVTGREVSVEGIVSGGRVSCVGVTEKWIAPPAFTEYRHLYPARITEQDRTDAIELAERAVRATGIDHCGFHVEVMLTHDGPMIIEVNGRLGGDFIASHLVPLASGVDLLEAAIQVAVGIEPELRPDRTGASCIRFLIAEQAGAVRQVDGLETAARSPGIEQFGVNKVAGDQVRLPPESYFDSRLAFAISAADDVETARLLADQAIEAVSYDIG